MRHQRLKLKLNPIADYYITLIHSDLVSCLLLLTLITHNTTRPAGPLRHPHRSIDPWTPTVSLL